MLMQITYSDADGVTHHAQGKFSSKAQAAAFARYALHAEGSLIVRELHG